MKTATTKNKSLKQIKLQGLRTPKILVWILGRVHGRKGKIVMKDNEWYSLYICRKQKQYQEYCASIWKEVAKYNEGFKKQLVKDEAELEEVSETLQQQKSEREKNLSIHNTESIRQQRRLAVDIGNKVMKKKMLLSNIPILRESIVATELEAEERLIEAKRRLEAIVTVYLQGASKYIFEDAAINLLADELAKEVYDNRYEMTNDRRGKATVKLSD